MSFTIKNILELEMMKNARLLAGESKTDNPVSWVNVMEILDSFDSLEKGELLITTGFGLNDYALHYDTIRLLANKNLAGIAVQPGYYIDSVPDFIITESEKYSIPLIELPKKLTFSSITRVVLNNIGIYDKQLFDLDGNQSNLLGTLLKKSYPSASETQDIKNTLKHTPERSFYCIILSFFERDLGILGSSDANASLNLILHELENSGASHLTGAINRYQGILVSAPNDVSPSDLEDLLNDITMQKKSIGENVLIHGGISRAFSDLSGLNQGFQEAESALSRLQHSSSKKGVLCFGNLELFKYICGQHAENANQFLENTLAPLYNYDEAHNSELMKTLRTFFRANLNYQDASKILFIHRHTMKYRIDKIRELLNVDLEDHDAKFRLSLALYLDKYYK